MENTSQSSEKRFQLKLDGKMTYGNYHELEAEVAEVMRHHPSFDVDLSAVDEVDLCGLHLIGLLQSVGHIVATSPAVDQASKCLLASLHAAALGRARRSERALQG